MEASLRLVRIVWMAMLVASFLYVWIPEQARVQSQEFAPAFYWVMVVLAIVMLVIIAVVRKATISRASEVLLTNPNDAAALLRWRAGQIVTMALCEVIVLYGLVVRFVGATRMQSAPLYALGIGALLVFRPQPVQ